MKPKGINFAFLPTFTWAGLVVFLHLCPPARGADPQIRVEPQTLIFNSLNNRTIYVELDWMEAADHTHKPSQQVIDRIVETFAAEGYAIVIEVGNAIPHQDMINLTGSPSSSPEVQAIRNEHFAHRDDSRYFYSIWGHEYNSNPRGSSGNADLPGRIHLVTLGTFPGQVGTFQHQVGTFIHELGHNLGQRHGGFDHANYKPNYISVMNYRFQLSGIGPVLRALGFVDSSAGFNDFGYSHGALPSLDESRLDERIGIGLGRAVDWNCDGDATDSFLAKDLQESSWCAASGGLSVISDFDNWGSINSFIQAGAGVFNVEPEGPSERCIGWEEQQAMLQALGPLAEATPPPVPANAPEAVDPGPGFMIFNDAPADLVVSSISKVTPAVWISWLPQPPFTISPGGSRLVMVTVDFTLAPVGRTTNQISIASNDPRGTTNVSIVVINQASTANLQLSQTPSSAPASVGCPLTYTIQVTNLGPTAATGVILSNHLPADVSITSVSASQGTVTQTDSNVVVQVGTLLFSSSATISITITPTAPSSLTNMVLVKADQVDPDPPNNTSVEIISAFVDTTGPAVETAFVRPDGHSMIVRFSEVVSGEAFLADRYVVTDSETNALVITGVEAGPNPQSVLLHLNFLTRFAPFFVSVSNISDCVGNPMASNNVVLVIVPPITLAPAGSIWKYLDNGTDPGSSWRTLTFNDGHWLSGQAQLGYGDDDEATEVGFGPDPGLKFVTTYFRKSFVVEDASKLTNAIIDLLRDDGADCLS